MIESGILNPQILSPLARVRYTNTLVISDRGFPFSPGIETVDISLVDDLPTVLQVLEAILPVFSVGEAYMAREFLAQNGPQVQEAFAQAAGVPHHLRGARCAQGAGARRHRPVPHRGHDPVRQHDPRVRLVLQPHSCKSSLLDAAYTNCGRPGSVRGACSSTMTRR